MSIPIIQVTPKPCETCGKMMVRKDYNGRLEDVAIFNKRRFCSLQCASVIHKKEKPSKSAIGKRLISQRKKQCEICGAESNLQMHHLDGNRYNNSSENLMTVCISCHTKWHWQHGKTMKRKYPACVVCGAESHARMMCEKHWLRYKKYGDPMLTKKNVKGKYVIVREEVYQPVGQSC